MASSLLRRLPLVAMVLALGFVQGMDSPGKEQRKPEAVTADPAIPTKAVGTVDLAPLYSGLREIFVSDSGTFFLMPVMALQAAADGKPAHSLPLAGQDETQVTVVFIPYPKGVFEKASEHLKKQFQDEAFKRRFFGHAPELGPSNIQPMPLTRLTCLARVGGNMGRPISSVSVNRDSGLVEATYSLTFPFVDKIAASTFVHALDLHQVVFEFTFEASKNVAASAEFSMPVALFVENLENTKAAHNEAIKPDFYSLKAVRRSIANSGTLYRAARNGRPTNDAFASGMIDQLAELSLRRTLKLADGESGYVRLYTHTYLDGTIFNKALIDKYESEGNRRLSQASSQIANSLHQPFQSYLANASNEDDLIDRTLAEERERRSGIGPGSEHLDLFGLATSGIQDSSDNEQARDRVRTFWRHAKATRRVKTKDDFTRMIGEALVSDHEIQTGHRFKWNGSRYQFVGIWLFEVTEALRNSTLTLNRRVADVTNGLHTRTFSVDPEPIPGSSYDLDKTIQELQATIGDFQRNDVLGQLKKLNGKKSSRTYVTTQRGVFTPSNKRKAARSVYDNINGVGWTEKFIQNGEILYCEYDVVTRAEAFGICPVQPPKDGGREIPARLVDVIFVPDAGIDFQHWGYVSIRHENSPNEAIRCYGAANTESNVVSGIFHLFHVAEE